MDPRIRPSSGKVSRVTVLRPDLHRMLTRTSKSPHVAKTWGCSCVGWRNHRKCKHLTDVLRRLAAVDVSAVADKVVVTMLASAKSAFLDLYPEKDVVAAPTLKGRDLDL